jgi:uncharacterized protein (DUF433 family)
MKMTLRGVIRGKTIELLSESGLPEGLHVEVTIDTTPPPPPAPPWWLERIVVDPAVLPAKPIVKGTRLEANRLVALLEEGRSEEELLRTYPELTRDDVAALREYAKVPLELRRVFGAWADEAEELDKYLEWNRQQRKVSRRRIED